MKTNKNKAKAKAPTKREISHLLANWQKKTDYELGTEIGRTADWVTEWRRRENLVRKKALGRPKREAIRSRELRIRVTYGESVDVANAAVEAGKTVSDYVRWKLGLEMENYGG